MALFAVFTAKVKVGRWSCFSTPRRNFRGCRLWRQGQVLVLVFDISVVIHECQFDTSSSSSFPSYRTGDYGFDLIDLLVGFDNAEAQLQALVDVIDAILNDDVNEHPGYLKVRCLIVYSFIHEWTYLDI